AIFAAATENWLARPSSLGSTLSIHSSGSKSTISHPFECANPVVANAVIGLTPLRPARSPAGNPDTPHQLLDTTSRPVITTCRGCCCTLSTVRSPSPLCVRCLVDDRDHALEIDHPGQLGLVDLHAERAFQRRENFDRAQRVSVVVLFEEAGFRHFLWLDL